MRHLYRVYPLIAIICYNPINPAYAWSTTDDHNPHTLRFEATPSLHALVKDEVCNRLAGVKDCLPHVSVEALAQKDVRVALKWRF